MFFAGAIILMLKTKETKEMSDSDYIKIFMENKETFNSIIQGLNNCEQGTMIKIDTNKIEGNKSYKDFLNKSDKSLVENIVKISRTNIINHIYVGDSSITFEVNNLPRDYRGGFIYSPIELIDHSFNKLIEGDWYLEILPNT